MAKRQPIGFIVMMLIMILFFGCDRTLDLVIPEPEPTESESEPEVDVSSILNNGDVELGNDQPDSWLPFIWGSNNYEMSWTTEDFHSSSHSLKMSLDTSKFANSHACWLQHLNLDAPPSNDFTITAHIKTENVVGDGVGFFVRFGRNRDLIPGAEADVFYADPNAVPISGTKDWDECSHSVAVSDVPPDTDCMQVFLIFLPKSTGTVYFDDITLNIPGLSLGR